MRRIDLYFLILAALCLITGVMMGIGMGIAHDFQFAPVHAHLNLLGWTSLALFGLTYKVYPALAQSRLALLHCPSSDDLRQGAGFRNGGSGSSGLEVRPPVRDAASGGVQGSVV